MSTEAANPLVSIIVPVYNVDAYLADCIKSIKNQTYGNTEIIFINDGSTDSSADILQDYERKNDRIKVLNQANAGVSAARNAGLGLSKGEYITFIDADDIVAPEYIERLVKLIKKDNSYDVSACHYRQIHKIEEITDAYQRDKYKDTVYDSESAILEIFYGTSLDSGPFCKLFSRNVVADTLFDESLIIGEDLDFLCKLFLKNNIKTVYTEEKLYGYRVRPNSAMTDTYSGKYLDYMNLVKSCGKNVIAKYPRSKKAVSYRLFGVASFCTGKIGRYYKAHKADYTIYRNEMKTNSMSVLISSRSSMKNRLFALGYVINARLTSWIRSNIISRSGV